MTSNLYKRFNYISDLKYIVSSFIREYDICKANINILYYYNVIDKNQYDYLYNLDKIDKKQREIQIGLLQQKDSKVATILKNGFEEFRKRFFIANDIEDSDVLSIKNDAIYLISRIPRYTKFDNIEFLNKNTYSSFYKIANIELYYFYDKVHSIEKLDVKGINDKKLKVHENYFLEFLKVIFCAAETEGINSVLTIIKNFYNKYISLQLDNEYYIEFNKDSMYSIKSDFKYFEQRYKVHTINRKQLKQIDISYNLNIILELYRIFSSIYFTNKN